MTTRRIYLLLVSLMLGGCATTQSTQNPKDPLEPMNRGIYQFNDKLDKVIVKPVAKVYSKVTPEPVKNMVRNFFSNLDDVVVTVNDLLQFKFAQAASDGARVIFNSTFGIFGLFNFADRLEKNNEDFGQTLGHWGVGSGPYLVLPLFGPSSVRDGVGLYADSFVHPMQQMDHMPTRNQLYATKLTSFRADLLKQEEVLEEAAGIDRYAFIRDAWMQRRQSLVYDGDPPREKIDEEEDGEETEKVTSDGSSDEDASPDDKDAGTDSAATHGSPTE